MPDITNPHDKFFKESFTKKEIAKGFIKEYLPPEVIRDIDIETLCIAKDSLIEKELKEYYSDIIYRVRIKEREVYIYLLFEHKSYPEPKTSFYLLRNMVKLWELKIKQREINKGLPVIIPLLIYHGREKWEISREFIGLFRETGDRLKEYIPDFKYELYDISHLRDEEIKGEIKLKALLLILKYIFREELKDRLHNIFRLLKELESKRSGIEYIETLLRYISSATDKIEEEDISKAIKEIEGGEELMPTLAEKWKIEGREEGERRSLLSILRIKFGDIPEDVKERIKCIREIEVLERLLEAAVRSESIERFRSEFWSSGVKE